MPKTALLIVDVQNDFCPGGSLAVRDGDKVVETLNIMIKLGEEDRWPIFASRDWHPRRSAHFKEFGGPWAPHCIRFTQGAKFHPELKLPPTAVIISKGIQKQGSDADVHGYSAFDGAADDGRLLKDILVDEKVEKLYVGGLATDYCVKASVIDACRLGFGVCVLYHACRAVEINPGDGRKALDEMMEAGAIISFYPYDSMIMRKGKNR